MPGNPSIFADASTEYFAAESSHPVPSEALHIVIPVTLYSSRGCNIIIIIIIIIISDILYCHKIIRQKEAILWKWGEGHYMCGNSLFNGIKFSNFKALIFLDKASLSLVLSPY